MFKKNNISKRVPYLRKRTLLMAVMFVLSLGNAAQNVFAQDGGTIPVNINSSMLAVIQPQEICIGEYATITVQVVRQRTPTGLQAGFIRPQTERRLVGVTAKVTDSSIASLGAGDMRQVISADSDVPGQVQFLIHAEAEGSTEVVLTTDKMDRLTDETFDDKSGGWFADDTVSKVVPVKVKNCEYKVNLTSNWFLPGEANVNIEAHFENETLERQDAAGKEYSGEATVQWKFSTSKVRDCEAQTLSWESKAGLKGEKDNNDTRLVVNLTFAPMKLSLPVKCVGSDGGTIDTSFEIEMTAGNLRLAVPADTGGVSTQSHDLKGPETSVGQAFINVYPSNAVK